MKIDVIKLKENLADDFEESLEPGGFDAGTEDVKYKGNIVISTEARKENNILFTKTRFCAAAEYKCSRCLKEYTRTIEKDFKKEYPLDKAEQFVDITQDIREEVILDYPVKFLCKPDCRGLCPKCGKDLNDGECSC